jgi:hypothetical protein
VTGVEDLVLVCVAARIPCDVLRHCGMGILDLVACCLLVGDSGDVVWVTGWLTSETKNISSYNIYPNYKYNTLIHFCIATY